MPRARVKTIPWGTAAAALPGSMMTKLERMITGSGHDATLDLEREKQRVELATVIASLGEAMFPLEVRAVHALAALAGQTPFACVRQLAAAGCARMAKKFAETASRLVVVRRDTFPRILDCDVPTAEAFADAAEMTYADARSIHLLTAVCRNSPLSRLTWVARRFPELLAPLQFGRTEMSLYMAASENGDDRVFDWLVERTKPPDRSPDAPRFSRFLESILSSGVSMRRYYAARVSVMLTQLGTSKEDAIHFIITIHSCDRARKKNGEPLYVNVPFVRAILEECHLTLEYIDQHAGANSFERALMYEIYKRMY